MRTRFVFYSLILVLAWLLNACAAAPAMSEAATEEAATEAPMDATENVPLATPTAEPSVAATEPAATLFPEGVWIGLPTYPADSLPDMAFQVVFDPQVWSLVLDPSGGPGLVHQQIPGCQIMPAGGRGLPPGLSVNHDMRRIGNLNFEINQVFGSDGELQFVTYLGGDASLYTGFEVDFIEQAEECRLAAEAVLGTLTSVQAPSATATPAELSPEVTPNP